MQNPRSGADCRGFVASDPRGAANCSHRVRNERSFRAGRFRRNEGAEKNRSQRYRGRYRDQRGSDSRTNRAILGEVGALMLELMQDPERHHDQQRETRRQGDQSPLSALHSDHSSVELASRQASRQPSIAFATNLRLLRCLWRGKLIPSSQCHPQKKQQNYRPRI